MKKILFLAAIAVLTAFWGTENAWGQLSSTVDKYHYYPDYNSSIYYGYYEDGSQYGTNGIYCNFGFTPTQVVYGKVTGTGENEVSNKKTSYASAGGGVYRLTDIYCDWDGAKIKIWATNGSSTSTIYINNFIGHPQIISPSNNASYNADSNISVKVSRNSSRVGIVKYAYVTIYDDDNNTSNPPTTTATHDSGDTECYSDYSFSPNRGPYVKIIAQNNNGAWSKPKCIQVNQTITLDKQGGSGGTEKVYPTYGSSMPSGASAPSRTGYEFGGYYTGTGGSGTQYYTSSMGSARNFDLTGNPKLYAKWTCITPSTPGSISGTTTVCAGGGSQTYSISSVSGATSYTWTLPGGWSGSSTSTSISATPGSSAQSGNITVTANNSCGSSSTRSLPVIVNTPPTAPTSINSSNGTTICSGSSTTLTASGGNTGSGCTYQWYSGNCGSGSVLGTSSSITISPTVTTTYYVRRVGTSPCSSTTTSCALVTVMVNSAPSTPGSISGTTTVCAGGGSQTYSISSVSGATSYNWTLPGGWSGSSTSTSISATPGSSAQSGNITVTANNSCGSSSTRSLPVTVNTSPTAPTSISGTTTITNGQSTTLTASGGSTGSGSTYQWGTGSCGSNIISGQTSASITVSPTTTTTYWVRRIGTSPCNSTTTSCATQSVTVNLSPANDLCANAISLSCGTIVSGTLAGATPTISISYTDYGNKNDVFYYFTAQNSGNHTITLNNFSDDKDLFLYSSCSTTTALSSSSGSTSSETVTYNCTAGTIYRIRVVDFSGNGGTFNIKVDCPSVNDCKTPPEYDYALPTPATEWQYHYGSINSVEGAPLSCYMYRVSITSGQTYSFQTRKEGGTMPNFNPELYIYDNNGSQIYWTGDNSNVTYTFNYTGFAFIRVSEYGGAGASTITTGTYMLAYKKIETPDNDNCSSAISLLCGDAKTGTLEGATPTTTFNKDPELNDVFYKFTATNAGNYTVTMTKSSTDNIDLMLYSGCDVVDYLQRNESDGTTSISVTHPCTENTTYYIRLTDYMPAKYGHSGGSISIKVDCPSPVIAPTVTTLIATNITQTTATLNKSVTAGSETITAQGFKYKKTSESSWATSTNGSLTGLTANTEYQFYAYATTASGTTNGETLMFTTLVPAPANDLCSNAISLSCGTPVSGTLAGATPTIDLTYDYDPQNSDVWYMFTANSVGNYTITFSKPDASAHNIDVGVYSSCSSTSNLMRIINNATSGSLTCSANSIYYIRVIDINSYGGSDFSIKVDCPDIVDCKTPQTLSVLVIEQDPYLKTKNNERASVYLNQDKDRVVNDLIDDISYSSHGNIIVNIVKKEHLDEFATFKSQIPLKNGENSYQLDEETWLEIMKDGWYGFWDNPYVKNIQALSYDYDYLINKFDLVNRRDRGEFDEVWLVNVDPENNYESMMVGASAYWINGSPNIKNTTNFKIMNVSISRPDANFECFGHAAENILRKVFGYRFDSYTENAYTVNNINDLNLWERFCLNEHATPGYSSAGNVHFAPNSVSDYDWENKTLVQSSWIDWLDYPNLTGKTKASNSDDWVPFTNSQFSAARQHHRWWFSLMPHLCEGRTKEGYSNNWWDYLFIGDYVTNITNNNSKSEYAVNEYITLNFRLDYLTGNVEYRTLDNVGINDLNVQIGNDNIVKLEGEMLKTISTGNTYIRIYYDNKYADFEINVSTNGLDEISPNTISIFPVPTRNDLFIQSDSPVEKVEVCSLTGDLLMRYDSFNRKISVSALSQGIYLLKVYTDKGTTVRKIVKE
ncbi:MAG: T9SS type A sorting domain-containing protein [Dysgonamonadaceae bacterium]|jgi:hypothetical protein|nr:T9SS type A sorting domain-containing protein [Dysgonamonadaceae bacterium]